MKTKKIPRHLSLRERDALVKQYKRVPIAVYWSLHTHPVIGRLGHVDGPGYGVIGLVGAANEFDPRRGVGFMTYAWQAVRNAIIYGAELNMTVRVPWTNWLSDTQQKRPRFAWRAAYVRRAVRAPHQLPADDEAVCVYDDWEPGGYTQDALDFLREQLDKLPGRYQRLLRDYFLGITFKEVGFIHGVSKQRAQQIIGGCLTKLRLAYDLGGRKMKQLPQHTKTKALRLQSQVGV